MFLLTVYKISLFVVDVLTFLGKAIWLSLLRPFQALFPGAKKSLVGEVVLITGAGHGLGRQLALEFSRQGADLVLWDINQEGNEETAQEIKDAGGRATPFLCDVTNREMVRNVAQQVIEKVGEVTILVNNAGILAVQPFLKHNHQQIRRIMEVNVMSHFWTIEEFLPRMMEMHHGHIVSVSSIAGRMPVPFLVPYCTSKFAVSGMMTTLSEEMRYLDYRDVHFTTVYPLFVNTGMFKSPKIKYDWLFKVDEPEDVAKLIVEGVQRNKKWVYTPPSMEYTNKFISILPVSIANLLLEMIDVGLYPQD